MEDNRNIWTEIAAPLAPGQLKHFDKKDKQGRKVATVPYVDARDVFDRLNAVCPGEWSFTWELVRIHDDGSWVVKGRLTIRDVAQEDVGTGAADAYSGPEKAAVSDAVKRCAYHFGFADEIYGNGHSGRQGESGAGRGGHWYDNPAAQKAFWTVAMDQLGLDESEVFRALGVKEDIREFGGLMTDAQNLLRQYASEAA